VTSENVVAYEIGYRAQPNKSFSMDVAGFINKYTDLSTIEPLSPFLDTDTVPAVTIEPTTFANKMHGTTGGVEVSLNWKITDRWTINPGYSLLVMRLHTDATSLDTASVAGEEGSSPAEQAQLRSRLDLSRDLTWNVNAYFVGALPAQFVPAYTRLDSQLTWRPEERLELSLVGQNLLSDHHWEFDYNLQSVNSTEVKRSVFAKVTWKF
jgi:iron complex outermembrane receptor protein